MAHLDFNAVSYTLGDGRPLLDEVTFRVADGSVTALVGPNGVGKSTLLAIAAGDLTPDSGAVTISGSLGIMRQFVGQIRDRTTVRELLISLAPTPVAAAAREMDEALAQVTAAEHAIERANHDPGADIEAVLGAEEAAGVRYAQAVADWVDLAGYEIEAWWDEVTSSVIGLPYEQAQHREVRTLSGGEQKRVVLHALFRSDYAVLILDEPDNYLDIPAKRWLEDQLAATTKTIFLVSHDREILANAATAIATLEPHPAGADVWVHGGSFASYEAARAARNDRLEELRRRWDEDHAKLKALVAMYKQKAAYNDAMASRLQAARTRLARFEQAGPPQAVPMRQQVTVRLRGGRTAKRAIVCTNLGLTGLTEPFDAELWFGERVAVIGRNGTGKSHFLRLLAAGGTDPEPDQLPVDDAPIDPVAHTGRVRLGSRVRPGWFAQTHAHPEFLGRTLLEILHRGDNHRDGMPREQASRALDRYGLARAGEQVFETLSGGQQARFQILLLELGGATLLLLDEPTDNLDLDSAQALEEGLDVFEGTVVAVTHDRWFMRGFDRLIEFGSDGAVREVSPAAGGPPEALAGDEGHRRNH